MTNPFSLFKVRYAMGFDESAMQAAQFGHFSSEPIWYHLSGCSLLLGDGQNANFELVACRGTSTCSLLKSLFKRLFYFIGTSSFLR
jgi:hypothetical protein